MDSRLLLADPAVRQEFLERASELTTEARRLETPGGFEGLEGGRVTIQPSDAVESMLEGRWNGEDPALEAIIRRFTRPVYLVRNGTVTMPPDDFAGSRTIADRLERANDNLTKAIPSVGRIELRNHRLAWVGTGWLIAPGIAVTNRHVAEEFGRRNARGFAFRQGPDGTTVHASLDCLREYRHAGESRFRIEEILWIEPEDSVDAALVRISPRGELGEPAPPPIPLMTPAELANAGVGAWVAVIGYPAYDSRCDPDDQRRIFDGLYNVKRLAPGQVTGLVSDKVLHHDATTLGGNSGSLVVDFATGRAAALHFGGVGGERNYAVQAPVISQMVAQHASVKFDSVHG
jgi:endonuclease G